LSTLSQTIRAFLSSQSKTSGTFHTEWFLSTNSDTNWFKDAGSLWTTHHTTVSTLLHLVSVGPWISHYTHLFNFKAGQNLGIDNNYVLLTNSHLV
jgi:hypothetical protein